MGPTALMILLVPVALLLATLFGRNAHKGLRTGVIYSGSHWIERRAQPVNFWIAFGGSVAFSAVSVAMVGVIGWAVVALA